ncbi:selenide, water dikinase SelD [Reinekea marinisedimentorum]|uniref:Selenide, water dikinase n=1 Tax=Reinekea marinisedimentorum TaxID=230495 RepID=A0A4V2UIJ7_9GAMM|nr:selenide, water dikinase SelD [Reinekea marinisedimentorum]TCS36450.1 selenide,water dikinase [Reinekea marinisedimentorum]
MSAIKLTEYSHGAGCGCKIAPQVLDTILKSQVVQAEDANLLVGNSSKDDAAVYDLGDGSAVISTTDFFMPIADDPFTFGRIAAANAISDIYAMGGTPLMAIAILGWPVSKLAPEVAQQVVDGGRDLCREAGILLAGGHSIDSPEPIFGLAVTGRVEIKNLKQNSTAQAGDLLYLTKPLGVGILTTAQKQKKLAADHESIAIENMCKLNKVGGELSKLAGVNAMTDVTGFGLMGHLSEVCQGSGLAAQVQYARVPVLPHVADYLAQGCIPGGTLRNYASYGHLLGKMDEPVQHLLCDPQTSGGLLVAVAPEAKGEVEGLLEAQGLYAQPIGQLREQHGEVLIEVV